VQLHVNLDQEPDAAYLARAGHPLLVLPPGLEPGSVTVVARLRISAEDPQHGLLGPCASLTFTLQTGTNALPVLTSLALANDTGSSATNGQTSDPTITGLRVNDGNVAHVTIQLDLDDDGQPDLADQTDEQGRFSIKPLGLEPGEMAVKLRAVEPAYPQGQIEGPWVAFAFTLIEPGAPQIATLGLARDNGASDTDRVTYNPNLSGTVAAEGDARLLLVELDTNDDGAAELTAPVDEQGRFTIKPDGLPSSGLPPGSITLHVGAVAADLGLAGEWLPFEFTLYQKPGPLITELALLRDTGASDTDLLTRDPTLSGTVSGAEDVAYATVQFDYTGDGEPDESAVADELGRFEHTPTNLQYGQHTVRVRASVFDAELGRELAGDWVSLTFTYQQPAGLIIEWLALLNDTGESDTDGITSDSTIYGQLGGEAVVALQQVEIDLNADGRADDTTTSDETGRFLYNARSLAGGSVTLAVRGVHWHPQHEAYIYGDWISLRGCDKTGFLGDNWLAHYSRRRKHITLAASAFHDRCTMARRSYQSRIRRIPFSQLIVRSTTHRTLPSSLPCSLFLCAITALIPSHRKIARAAAESCPRSAYSFLGRILGAPGLPLILGKASTAGRIWQYPSHASRR
jgi:hypothetical protein